MKYAASLSNLLLRAGLVLTFLYAGLSATADGEKLDFTAAVLSYKYQDVKSGEMVKGSEMQGFFGLVSRLESEEGRLVHVLTEDGANHGCSELQNVPTQGKWIALIERGQCKFHDKIVRAAVEGNASAVIVYDHEHNEQLLAMSIYGKYNMDIDQIINTDSIKILKLAIQCKL